MVQLETDYVYFKCFSSDDQVFGFCKNDKYPQDIIIPNPFIRLSDWKIVGVV